LFVVAALALALRPRRRPATIDDEGTLRWIPLADRPSMPLRLDLARVLRYEGPAPGLFATIATTTAATVAGWAVADLAGGLILGIAAMLAVRVRETRPLLTIGPPLIFVATVGWIIFQQTTANLPPGFDWPTYLEGAHRPAWIAVLLLVLDGFVERVWLRRWWPTDDDGR